MLIQVRTNPNSKAINVDKLEDNKYQVSLKASARKGKANTELVKTLSKYFGCRVRIVSGFKSKNKIVEICD
jgi:uncharacterized protein (TIGR00251 family)